VDIAIKFYADTSAVRIQAKNLLDRTFHNNFLHKQVWFSFKEGVFTPSFFVPSDEYDVLKTKKICQKKIF